MTSAAESSARDHAAIAAGTPSFSLMLRAGTQAAAVILRDFGHCVQRGVALYAGVGNNGGDAYIVAAQLARAGIRVRLSAMGAPRTADAQRAARLAAHALVHSPPTGREGVVVDGLLGTGHRGALREEIAVAGELLGAARAHGATVVALDMPSGVDATSGEISDGAVVADVTVTFGTIKRGLLVARAHAGRIVLVDIGLVDIGLAQHEQAPDEAWIMADDRLVAGMLPSIAWNAYKSRRGQLALVGGAVGMAGAAVLAVRAAVRAGAGLVHGYVETASVPALQQCAPQAIAHAWPATGAQRDGHRDLTLTNAPRTASSGAAGAGADGAFADARGPDAPGTVSAAPWGSALAIGPGLGRTLRSRALLWQALRENAQAPLLLDADALTLLTIHASATDQPIDERMDVAATLRALATAGRAIVCTPHVGEFARMLGAPVPTDWQQRADVLRAFAVRAGATILLKGTPTLIASADGSPLLVMARGNAALATGGSGDLLSGIIGALLAQGLDGPRAALLGATAHGLAAEHATGLAGGEIRGITLDEVLNALPLAWRQMQSPKTLSPGVLHELPNIRCSNGLLP